MDTLYSYSAPWAGLKIELTPTQLSYETGIVYMKKRGHVPVSEIASITPATLSFKVTIETTGGKEHELAVFSAKEREKLYSALQQAITNRS